MSDYLTTEQAAAALKVSPAHVRRLCGAGALAGAEHWGRDWRIPQAAVDAYHAVEHKRGAKRAQEPAPA